MASRRASTSQLLRLGLGQREPEGAGRRRRCPRPAGARRPRLSPIVASSRVADGQGRPAQLAGQPVRAAGGPAGRLRDEGPGQPVRGQQPLGRAAGAEVGVVHQGLGVGEGGHRLADQPVAQQPAGPGQHQAGVVAGHPRQPGRPPRPSSSAAARPGRRGAAAGPPRPSRRPGRGPGRRRAVRPTAFQQPGAGGVELARLGGAAARRRARSPGGSAAPGDSGRSAPPSVLVVKNCCCSRSSSTAALPVVPSRASQVSPVSTPRVQVRTRNDRRSTSQPVQHVAGQVGPDQPGPPAQLAAPPAPGRARLRPAGGQVEQLQAGRPAPRTPGQRRRRLRGQRLGVDRAEQLLDLPGAKPQIVPVELAELAGDQQPRGVQGGRPAAAEQHPHARAGAGRRTAPGPARRRCRRSRAGRRRPAARSELPAESAAR